jgi:hypothetical protein
MKSNSNTSPNSLVTIKWLEKENAKNAEAQRLLNGQLTHRTSSSKMDASLNTKEDSPPLTGPSSWEYRKLILEPISNYYSEPTINLIKDPINDIPNGQQRTDSISPSGFPREDGSEREKNNFKYPPNYLSYDTDVNTKEYPDNNPKTVFGAKKIPLELVPPSAIHALAEAFENGANRYGAYNWRERTISSSVYYGAALRHLSAWWDGEEVAVDSGINHLHHALACIALIIDGRSVGKLNDNRPPKGAAAQMQQDWLSKCDRPEKD